MKGEFEDYLMVLGNHRAAAQMLRNANFDYMAQMLESDYTLIEEAVKHLLNTKGKTMP